MDTVSSSDPIYTGQKQTEDSNSKALLVAPGGNSVHYTQHIRIIGQTKQHPNGRELGRRPIIT